ncbi:hypothetical protein ABZT45_28920 [Streptomyces sp. NPDC005356]|uniref:hypothetical protein n=1 Tax=Streptomyces sp. NPDC005356 TaxID=3157167 RepID=UPI0033AE8BB3
MRTNAKENKKRLRNTALAGLGGLLAVLAFLFAYGGAFGQPKPHDLEIAVVDAPSVVQTLQDVDGVTVTQLPDWGTAEDQVAHNEINGAMTIGAGGDVNVAVADGGGRSVASAVTDLATPIADASGGSVHVDDLAPLSSENPNGTFEFYGIIFLGIGASLGATVFGRTLGPIQGLRGFTERLVTTAVYTAAAAALVTYVLDGHLGALAGHPWGLFLTLWAFTATVCLALSGINARFGMAPGIIATLGFVLLGNSSAGGAVPPALLNSFYAALTPVLPHGAALSALRGVQYFDGHGVTAGLVCCAVWAAGGILLLARAAHKASRSARHERVPEEAGAKPSAEDAEATTAALVTVRG